MIAWTGSGITSLKYLPLSEPRALAAEAGSSHVDKQFSLSRTAQIQRKSSGAGGHWALGGCHSRRSFRWLCVWGVKDGLSKYWLCLSRVGRLFPTLIYWVRGTNSSTSARNRGRANQIGVPEKAEAHLGVLTGPCENLWMAGSPGPPLTTHQHPADLTTNLQSLFRVDLQKSAPPQIRQLVVYYYQYNELVDEFVWELSFAKTT